MPAFSFLQDAAIEAVTQYLTTGEEREVAVGASPAQLKYTVDGYNKILDVDGYPAVEPPWGTLNAINLDSGEIEWKIPLGEFPELAVKGMPNTGSENYGGPVATAGGLLFTGTRDKKVRAFDVETGKPLWEAEVDAALEGMPAVYQVDGREYIVFCAAAQAGLMPATQHPIVGAYVAYALPRH